MTTDRLNLRPSTDDPDAVARVVTTHTQTRARLARAPRSARRGFAVVVALTMITLVAVALVLIAQLTRLDLVRTHDERVDAQLRQVLLAGIALLDPTTIDPDNRSGTHGELALPVDLQPASLSVIDTAVTRTTCAATLEATLAGRTLSQRLEYARSNDTWQLVRAEWVDSAARTATSEE